MASWNYDDEEINGVIDSNIKDSPPNPPGVNTASTMRNMLKLYWAVIRNQVSTAVNYVDLQISTALATISLQLNTTQAEISEQLSSTLTEVEERVNAAETLAENVFDTFSLADVLGTYNASTGIATRKQAGTTFTPVTVATEATGKAFDIVVAGTVDIFGTGPVAVAVGGRIVSRGTKWDYIPPADTGYSKSIVNEALIYQKFNEVFSPAAIAGWEYKAKGRGTVGTKRVQACIVFNVSAISYGGSAVDIKFDAKIISKSSNCLSISERLIQGRDSATPATGTTIPMFAVGGTATLVKDVTYAYSVTGSWTGAKSNYLHVYVDFDPIDEDAINDLIIYDAKLTVGGVSGIVGLSALYLPNVGDTTTVITSLTPPAATVSFANERELNAKVYTDSLLNYFQDNANFDLHLATTGTNWYSSPTNNFLVEEDNPYLIGLGVKKQVKLNDGQFVTGSRRDLLYRVIYPTIIDGKYIQTVFFIKTDDPGKFKVNSCYVAKTLGVFTTRTPTLTTVTEVSAGVWEIRNTFQAPASGDYYEVWVGSSFTDSGTDTDAPLSVSGFMCYIQSDPILYPKLSTVMPDIRKRIKVVADSIPLIPANPLAGKKLGALGDSITQGHGTVLGKTYHELVAARNAMVNYNYGLSGTRVCDDRVGFGLGMSNPDRYTAMDSSLDYITVWGGTNDVLAVGSNNDMTRETFKGALNLLCIGLIERYPTKKIALLTPLNHRVGSTMLAYADAILEIGHKFGIPGLDLFREAGIYPLNDIQRTALMYTSSDFQHPNELGHKIISDKYEAFLRRL